MTLHNDLIGAVARREIMAWYQPQLDLSTGLIVAAEALSRWQHPQRGLLAPSSFIDLAETVDLIGEIGEFMLDDGCECAAAWLAGGTSIEVSVNVSASQLANSAFFDRLAACLLDMPLDPHLITLEITESRVIADRDDAAVRLNRLRSLGVGVSIDDFGTGFSSIDQVLALPATELKIDRSLVQGEVRDGETLMAAVVGLAHERGLRVVAEGIESASQLELARDLGCDRAQGYLIGMPMPKDELTALLSA